MYKFTLVVDPDFGVFDRWYYRGHVDSAIEIDPIHFVRYYRSLHVYNTEMMASTMMMAPPFGRFAIYQIDTVMMHVAAVVAEDDDDDFVADNDSCAFGCDREFDLFYYRHWLNEI